MHSKQILTASRTQQNISKKHCVSSYADKRLLIHQSAMKNFSIMKHSFKGSKHFSYVFRHSLLPHEDGSLSLNELLNHRGSQVKLRSMRNHGPEILFSVNKSSSFAQEADIRLFNSCSHWHTRFVLQTRIVPSLP